VTTIRINRQHHTPAAGIAKRAEDHPRMTQPLAPAASLHDHLVHEAVGPSLSGTQAGATIGVGVNSLMILGVLPVLLGALDAEHRLNAAQIGLAAALEVLTMGLVTAAMGMIRRPGRLRLIAVSASVGLAALDLGCMPAAGPLLLALRAGAGAVEGVLLWITISMIARTVTPERWAGVFFTAQTAAQLLLAIAFAVAIVPRFGASGAFAALAACSLLGVLPALMGPSRFEPLPIGPGESEAPPARGWLALAATLIYISAGAAVGVYLQPLARQAGLGASVAQTALWVSLVGQVTGGAMATLLAGRVRYFTVFIITSVVYLGCWALLGFHQPAWLFVANNAVAGVVGLFLAPFLVPMTIAADPSRRAAVLSGAAQLLGGALGPLLASQVVSDRDVHGVLWLGGALLILGLVGVAGLRFTTRRAPVAQA
jgi:DHA1 family inner membrane transport protein